MQWLSRSWYWWDRVTTRARWNLCWFQQKLIFYCCLLILLLFVVDNLLLHFIADIFVTVSVSVVPILSQRKQGQNGTFDQCQLRLQPWGWWFAVVVDVVCVLCFCYVVFSVLLFYCWLLKPHPNQLWLRLLQDGRWVVVGVVNVVCVMCFIHVVMFVLLLLTMFWG